MPTFEIDMDDGNTYTVEAADQESAIKAVTEHNQPKQEETSYTDMALSAAAGAADLLTLDQAHKVGAGAANALGYDVDADELRQSMDQIQAQNPGSSMAGGVAASFTPVAGPLARGGRLARIGKSAAVGAGYEGAHQTLNDEKYNTDDIVAAGGIGAAGGGVGIAANRLLRGKQRKTGEVLNEEMDKHNVDLDSVTNDPTDLGLDGLRRSIRELENELNLGRLPDNLVPQSRQNLNNMKEMLASREARAAVPATTERVVDTPERRARNAVYERHDPNIPKDQRPPQRQLQTAKPYQPATYKDIETSPAQAAVAQKPFNTRDLEDLRLGLSESGGAATGVDQKNLGRMSKILKKNYSAQAPAGRLYKNRERFAELRGFDRIRTALESGKPREGIQKIISDRNFFLKLPKEIQEQLEQAARDPGLLRSLAGAYSRISPIGNAWNLMQGNFGYAAAQGGAQAAGKFAKKSFTDKQLRELAKEYGLDLTTGQRGPNMMGPSVIAPVGIFGGIE